MTTTISAFTPELVIPKYNETNYDNSLEVALLMKKQQQYDTFLSRVHTLQNQGLNVSMLNMKGKQKLDEYNREIDDMLSGDLGDLSNEKVQSKVASMFNKISMDTDLKERSRLSSFYQQQMSTIENMRNSKDPTKSGYNSINEAVFRKWDGGLEDFMLADDINGFDQKKQGYVPYKDIDQKLVNLTKLLHEESQLVQKPHYEKIKVMKDGKEVIQEVPTGYDILTSSKGVSSERIRGLFEATLDQDERSQLEVLSKYRMLQNDSPEGRTNLYGTYTGWLKAENRNTKSQLEQVQALKTQYEETIKGLNLPPDELAVKKALYQNEIDNLNEREILLTTKVAQQIKNQMSIEDWNKLSRTEMLPFINQLTTESYVNGISDSLAWKEEVSKVGMDETFFANAKINNMQDRLNLDAALGQARIQIEQAKLQLDIQQAEAKAAGAKGSKGESFTQLPTGDIMKNPTEVFSSWDKTMEISKEYNDKTTPIITSKDKNGKYNIDPLKLNDTRWLDDNKNNHEVQMWNAYKARMGDKAYMGSDKKPNLAGFEAFKVGIKNGDYKNDERLNQIWDGYTSDLQVTDWFNKMTLEVADAVNKQTNIGSVRVGSGPTLANYAEMNKWDGRGEMRFGVKDGKGGYKQMTWSEVKSEYKKARDTAKSKNTKDIYGNELGLPIVGDAINKVTDAFPNLAKIEGILGNDINFARTVEAAIIAEENKGEMIKEIFNSKLPQFLQNKHALVNEPSAIYSYIGDINSANKLVPGKENVGDIAIDRDAIAQIAVPVGDGFGAFQIKKDYVKSYEGIPLMDTQGTIDENPSAGKWYKFNTTPLNPRDFIMNAMFENIGEVSKVIDGKKVVIRDDRNSPYLYVLIDGVPLDKPPARQDVNIVFNVIASRMAQQKQLSNKPK